MSENLDNELFAMDSVTWLALPDFAAKLGVRDRDVRSWLRDRRVVSIHPGMGPQIPAEFLSEGEDGTELLHSLPGTLTLLADCGLSETESMQWLLSEEDELGTTPLAALREGRTHAVRQVARMLL